MYCMAVSLMKLAEPLLGYLLYNTSYAMYFSRIAVCALAILIRTETFCLFHQNYAGSKNVNLS